MNAAMGMMGLGIVLTLRDQASRGLEALRGKLAGFQNMTKEMVKTFDDGVKKIMGGFGMMWAGTKTLSVLNNTIGASVDTAASFEQAMARVKAVSGATGDAFDSLAQQARQLGRDTQFSATQAANSQELLARAGFKTEEIIKSMPGLLNMAAAEGMGLAEAADIASGTLRGFGMSADEMTRIANVLAKGSASSNVSISTLGEALRNVAPDAKSLGLSLEETIAILGKMGDSAIKGGRAGTALSSIMSKISAPTSAAKEALASLGVTTTDMKGNLLKVPEILDNISKGMMAKGLGTAQKQEVLRNLFGLTSKTEAQVILDVIDNGGLSDLTEKLKNAGNAAGDMANVMNDTLEGARKRLDSASEGLRIAVGNIFTPAFKWFTDKAASFKSFLTGLIESFPFLSKVIIGGTTALVAFAGAALTAGGALAAIGGAMKIWPMIVTSMTSGLKTVTSLIPGLREGVTLFRVYRSYGHTVGEALQFLTMDAGNWLLGLFKAIPTKITYILKAIPSIFNKAFRAIPKIIKGAFNALMALPGPIKVIIALAGALYAAWKTNFAGLRDMFTAISAGWKMMMSADENGIAKVDAETAARLKKSGIWDYAVTMFGVFYRLRRFWEGLVEGFGRGVDSMKAVASAIYSSISGALSPVFEMGKPLLGMLGLIRPDEGSDKAWHDWGVAIGQCVPWILLAVGALKAWKAIQVIWNATMAVSHFMLDTLRLKTIAGAIATKVFAAAQWLWNAALNANPIGLIVIGIAALVAAGYYLYKNWDKVKAKLIAAWNVVWDKIKAFGSWIKNISISIWNCVATAWNWVKGKVAAGWDWVKSKVVGFWNWLAGFFTWDTVLTAWEATKTGVQKAWNELKAWIASFIPDWLANPWDTLVSLWETTVASIKQGWQIFKSWIASFIPDWIANPWEKLVTWLSETWDAVKQKWAEFKAWIASFIPDFLSDPWRTLQSGWNSAQGLIESGWNTLKNSFLGDWASGVWKGLVSGAEEAWRLIEAGWNKVTDWIGSGLDSAWNGVVGAWDWVWGNDPNARTQANDQQLMAAQVKDMTMLNKMYEGFKDRVAEMWAAWEPFKASLGEGFQNIYTVMADIGNHIRSAVIPAVNELVGALKRIASELNAISQLNGLEISIPAPKVPTSTNAIDRYMDRYAEHHALGGIFSVPHIGMVADDGPEAVIPLNDPSRGIPLMAAAANMMGLGFANAPAPPASSGEGIATRYLARMARSRETDSAGDISSSKSPDKQIQIKNDVNMKVEAVTTPVYLDGRLLGEFITRFNIHEAMREGALA